MLTTEGLGRSTAGAACALMATASFASGSPTGGGSASVDDPGALTLGVVVDVGDEVRPDRNACSIDQALEVGVDTVEQVGFVVARSDEARIGRLDAGDGDFLPADERSACRRIQSAADAGGLQRGRQRIRVHVGSASVASDCSTRGQRHVATGRQADWVMFINFGPARWTRRSRGEEDGWVFVMRETLARALEAAGIAAYQQLRLRRS